MGRTGSIVTNFAGGEGQDVEVGEERAALASNGRRERGCSAKLASTARDLPRLPLRDASLVMERGIIQIVQARTPERLSEC